METCTCRDLVSTQQRDKGDAEAVSYPKVVEENDEPHDHEAGEKHEVNSDGEENIVDKALHDENEDES